MNVCILISTNVRRSIIPWICSFLTCRRQAVKIGSTVSQWLPASAGVPKETKLGPILFIIMINDLTLSSSKTSHWKYVNDITFSEVVQGKSSSESQVILDKMIISFAIACDFPPALSIGEDPLERVECRMV